ncbi:hypothetical protein IWQ60_011112 [Tieghemiomyces parasiticus]|uniref:Uncharacterized protein n=1 Tax=Tieghemiomyces parasiticus TaxID=78921 RepID=A0A9W7ZHY4_9FUNG|nr:hypothetical protein IWQ60_011112 [Tieghemiomyces parasiticus]
MALSESASPQILAGHLHPGRAQVGLLTSETARGLDEGTGLAPSHRIMTNPVRSSSATYRWLTPSLSTATDAMVHLAGSAAAFQPYLSPPALSPVRVALDDIPLKTFAFAGEDAEPLSNAEEATGTTSGDDEGASEHLPSPPPSYRSRNERGDDDDDWLVGPEFCGDIKLATFSDSKPTLATVASARVLDEPSLKRPQRPAPHFHDRDRHDNGGTTSPSPRLRPRASLPFFLSRYQSNLPPPSPPSPASSASTSSIEPPAPPSTDGCIQYLTVYNTPAADHRVLADIPLRAFPLRPTAGREGATESVRMFGSS